MEVAVREGINALPITAVVLSIVAGVVGWLFDPKVAAIVFLSGWIVTLILGYRFARNQRIRHEERMIHLANTLTASDSALSWWFDAGRLAPVGERKDKLQSMVKELLVTMCEQLAPHLPSSHKAATLLILRSFNDQGQSYDSFELFAQHNHPEHLDAAREIQHKLRHRKGLAGAALEANTCIVIKNCGDKAQAGPWINTHSPPRFLGRASYPISAVLAGEGETIYGALCFDVKPSYLVPAFEQELIGAFAQKIGILWFLLGGGDGPGPAVRQT